MVKSPQSERGATSLIEPEQRDSAILGPFQAFIRAKCTMRHPAHCNLRDDIWEGG
jgi:hypothetical protein